MITTLKVQTMVIQETYLEAASLQDENIIIAIKQ
jgi:hypothetical protein